VVIDVEFENAPMTLMPPMFESVPVITVAPVESVPTFERLCEIIDPVVKLPELENDPTTRTPPMFDNVPVLVIP